MNVFTYDKKQEYIYLLSLFMITAKLKVQFIVAFVLSMLIVINTMFLQFSSSISPSENIENLPFSNSSTLVLNGIISSLIFDLPITINQTNGNTSLPSDLTRIQKFILAGDWNIDLYFDNNSTGQMKVRGLTASFIGISEDGSGGHEHQISNFRPLSISNSETNTLNNKTDPLIPHNILNSDGDARILGTVDLGINGQKIWEKVGANITISEGKTIKILLDNEDVDFHFGEDQAIFGLVNGITQQ